MNEIKPGQFVVYNSNPPVVIQKGEMSLRDYFAAKALQGLLANPKLQPEIIKHGGARSGWIEESAYGFADAMLKERTNERT